MNLSEKAAQAGDGKIRGSGGKFLTFFLAGEEYGLEILKVQEIIGMMDITPVPHTPECVKGVLNLRGKVIPVEEIEDAPVFGAEVRTDFILGIGKSENRVRLLLDIDRVMADGDLSDFVRTTDESSKQSMTQALAESWTHVA